jgi:hypothetical protein
MAWVETIKPEFRGGVQEDQFAYAASIPADSGIEFIYNYPVYITQIVANWTTSCTVTLSVLLPSGTSYTIQSYSTATSLTLNTRSENYIYWNQLPAGSRIRFEVSVASTTNLDMSIISSPI